MQQKSSSLPSVFTGSQHYPLVQLQLKGYSWKGITVKEYRVISAKKRDIGQDVGETKYKPLIVLPPWSLQTLLNSPGRNGWQDGETLTQHWCPELLVVDHTRKTDSFHLQSLQRGNWYHMTQGFQQNHIVSINYLVWPKASGKQGLS